MGIDKKFGQWKQSMGERFGKAQKTEYSNDFLEVERKALQMKSDVKHMLKHVEKLIGREKDSHIYQDIGLELVGHGSMLNDSSNYGFALVKTGEVEQLVGKAHVEFAHSTRAGFVTHHRAFLDRCKDAVKAKKKLEDRRLDYDARLSKKQKGAQKPKEEEEFNLAKDKFENQYQIVEKLYQEIVDSVESHRETLVKFVQDQLTFHEQCYRHLEALQHKLAENHNWATAGERRPSARVATNNPDSDSGSESEKSGARRGSAKGSPSKPGSESPGANKRSYSTPTFVPSGGQSAGDYRRPSGPGIASEDGSAASSPLICPRARALYAFDPENEDEMPLRKGDIIENVEKADAGWWVGDCNGRHGLFPANYVEMVTGTQSAPISAGRSPVAPLIPSSNPTSSYSSLPASAQSYQSSNSPLPSGPASANDPSRDSFGASNNSSFNPNRSQQFSNPPSGPMSPRQPVAMSVPSTPSADSMPRSPGFVMPSPDPQAPSSASVAPCRSCGCNDFQRNPFKKGTNCNNCFHNHME